MTAIHFACFHGQAEILKKLLIAKKAFTPHKPLKIKKNIKYISLLYIASICIEKENAKLCLDILLEREEEEIEKRDDLNRNVFHHLAIGIYILFFLFFLFFHSLFLSSFSSFSSFSFF